MHTDESRPRLGGDGVNRLTEAENDSTWTTSQKGATINYLLLLHKSKVNALAQESCKLSRRMINLDCEESPQ